MKAVVYEGNGCIAVKERPRPKLEHTKDAIVRVTLAAICSSDIHIKHGSVPKAVPGIVLGHEFVGVVEETGSDVKNFKPGQRVAVNVETFCGECFFCRRGYVNNCTDPNGGWAMGCRIDGGQAEYVRVPYADNGLTLIPDSVSDEQAIFTGDLLSTGEWACRISDIEKDSTVAVIGAGPAGICTMLCARLYQPKKIIAIDISQDRLDMVKAAKIADHVINPTRTDVGVKIEKLTKYGGADAVIEMAGGEDTFDMAWRIARPNAVVCIGAMYEENQSLPLPQMYGKNLTFKTGGVDACRCGEIMKLIESGKIDGTCLITHRFNLEDAMTAYDIFENKKDGVIKVVLKMPQGH